MRYKNLGYNQRMKSLKSKEVRMLRKIKEARSKTRRKISWKLKKV